MMDDLARIKGEQDLRSVARTLGVYCIEHEAEINDLRDTYGHVPAASVELDRAMAGLGDLFWQGVSVGERSIADALEVDSVARLLGALRTEPLLLPWVLLRAFCAAPLRVWFNSTRQVITLKRGDPFPIVCGPPLAALFEPTPHPARTNAYNELLFGTGFQLNHWDDGGSVVVELDYSRRQLLDEAVWGTQPDSPSLPRISSIHPYAQFEGEFEIRTEEPEWWFDVVPTRFDEDGLCEALTRLGERANIAIIPELSLPRPDALAEFMRASASAVPPFVIAGSAHCRPRMAGRELRVNACEVYFEGVPILSHHKRHPVQFKLNGSCRKPEGLTNEQKRLRVISGDRTRLAVVICADLNDARIPLLLQSTYVNILLVPAMTPGEGAFEGAMSGVASQCQGFSVIVNGSPPREDADRARQDEPFMVMIGIPRKARQVTSVEPADSYGRQAIGVIDLMYGQVEWEAYS